jgi:aspartyl-tRNA(Asn)/glutamyl-tRNA(Gln) amidotransferase subunit C
MANKLTREQIVSLARLARLKIDDEEVSKYQSELSVILDYIDMLDNIDVSGLEPTYQVTGLQNVFREDVVQKQPTDAGKLLSLTPSKQDRYIKVKRMI